MAKKSFLIAGLIALVLISGCVQQPSTPLGPVCGDGICNSGETESSCIEDCALPPMPPTSNGGAEQPPSLPF